MGFCSKGYDKLNCYSNIIEKEAFMEKKCEKAELTNCIKKKAKELWEKDGCKQGRDLDYWLRAEKIVKSQTAKY